jgi:hypothetical protein
VLERKAGPALGPEKNLGQAGWESRSRKRVEAPLAAACQRAGGSAEPFFQAARSLSLQSLLQKQRGKPLGGRKATGYRGRLELGRLSPRLISHRTLSTTPSGPVPRSGCPKWRGNRGALDAGPKVSETFE